MFNRQAINTAKKGRAIIAKHRTTTCMPCAENESHSATIRRKLTDLN